MRIGILGAGGMAREHAAAYVRMKGVEIAGFYGRHRGKVEATAKQFGALATTKMGRILRDGSIDAVDVVVPSGVHRDPVIAALEAGKDVFCETPVALTLEDADAMLRAARRSGRRLQCAQLMRFASHTVHVRETERSGRLGAVTFVLASRLSHPYWSTAEPRPFSTYGEPIAELMIFDFNFLNWLLGSPSSVTAQGLRGDRNAADHVLAEIRYPRALGVAEGSARMPGGFPFNTRLRVLFEGGLQEADFRIKPDGFSSSFVEYAGDSAGRKIRVPGRDPYAAECAHFVSVVRGNADPDLLDAVHDRDALRVALAARTSLRTGRKVSLPPRTGASGRP